MAERIGILREFRGKYLLTNLLGECELKLHYKVSPPMVEFIAKHPSMKPIVKVGIFNTVAMSPIIVKASSPCNTVI